MATISENRALLIVILFGFTSSIKGQQQSSDIGASPFFFYCKQYDKLPALQHEWDQSSIKIAQVEIAGNPRSYIAGQVYKVVVRLPENFDSSRITGVYSANPGGPLSKQIPYQRKMCTILQSNAKQRLSTRVEFYWMAPPEEMGCIDFVGTFTRQDTVVLKDERIYHICPSIDELGAESVTLSGLDQEGVIFRDDFETGHFSSSLWTNWPGFQVNKSCDPIFNGLSATLCSFDVIEQEQSPVSLHLSTVAVNATSAGTLQFTIGRTSCSNDSQLDTTGFNASVSILYGQLESPYDTECSNWVTLRTINLPKNREPGTHIVDLSPLVRRPETCFRWSVQTVETGCFAIDDVIVINTDNRRSELHADFDPLSTGDWLSLPGGHIHSGCKGSKGSALVFNSKQRGPNLALTQDLQLGQGSSPSNDILWQADFDALLSEDRWEFESAKIDEGCETELKRRLVVQQTSNNSVASACSPLLDLSLAGNLRFRLEPFNQCKKTTKSKSFSPVVKRFPGKLNVWIERNNHKKKITLLSGLLLNEDPITQSLTITNEGQIKEAKVCWQLLDETASPWIVDDIVLLPAIPSSIEHVLQFRLNTACDLPTDTNTTFNPKNSRDEFHIVVQYSSDKGNSWNSLHDLCLPPTCSGVQSSVIQASWSSHEMSLRPWERITLPLPYSLLFDSGRIRFLQKGRLLSDNSPHWALDDIHLAECPLGCSGHGTCLEKGVCSCDDGYNGDWCQLPIQQLPSALRENFERENSIDKRFLRFSGVKLSTRCGQVGAGLAAIFDQSDNRKMVTFDMDTTESQILRFALRINGPGSQLQHHCPGPNRPVESIYIHSSCNGGITWSLLKFIQPHLSKEESNRFIRIHLPKDAQGSSCRFKFWQAQHSGAGKDVWAIDDLYIGPNLTHSLTRNSSSGSLLPMDDAFVGRHQPEEFCKRKGVMVLQSHELEETHPVRIEPFSVIQLEVAVGCSPTTPLLNNNSVVVQFSVDGGKHWNDLDDTRRHVTYLQDWRRISAKLPPESWSEATRFRVAQTGRPSDRSLLAVDYFYAGPDECPELCRGNGRCSLSGCVCDHGFSGENCLPDLPLSVLKSSDEASSLLIGGRNYVTDRDGCLVRGTRNLIFDELGMRSLETKEIDYSPGVSVLFFLRLGDCELFHDESYDIHVLLELSWDGGSEWSFLREYRSPFFAQPQLEQIEILPPIQRSKNPPPFKIRFVQTGFHVKDQKIWSLAGLSSSSKDKLSVTDISNLEQPLNQNEDLWLVRNEPDLKSSCLVFDTNCLSRIAWYGALTKEVVLDVGDSIQFDLIPQRSDSAAFPDTREQILFQYSADGGLDWHLVQPECLHSWSNCPGFHQSSRIDYRSFRTSDGDKEDRFHYQTSEAMATKPILLRWLHHRLGDQQHHPLRGFQIQNLYIGSPCPSLCSGHGRCWQSICTCDDGYSGSDCSENFEVVRPAGFYDTFPYKESENSTARLSSYWSRLIGGKLMPNYCDGFTDGVVFFGGRGPRSLQTTEIDTQNLRMVQFTLAVTSVPIYRQNCRLSSKRKSLSNETPTASILVLDYSNNNGLTWTPLDSWPLNAETEEKRLGVSLPFSARTPATIIRWWQLTYPNTNNKDGLQWYLDDVLVNLNVTNPNTFEYELDQADEPFFEQSGDGEFEAGGIADWLGWQGLITRGPLYPVDTLLIPSHSEDGSSLSYAETWDMEITDPTFAQFQLILPLESHSENVDVRFEYSTDMGRHWQLVEPECYMVHQLGQQCEYLHPPSRYLVRKDNNATRTTVYLPKRSITESTRFRWISQNEQDHIPASWGVGHVYIGGTCPWMCSGHGTCHNGRCNCDEGYGNVDCVPIEPLPQSLLSHFDGEVQSSKVYLSGGGVSSGCGVLMSGSAAVFHQGGLRYVESIDLDLTKASYAQMTVKFNCWAETESFLSSPESSHHRLVLQYSVNGGITWILIQEVKMQPQHDPQLLIVNLMKLPERTNCTRLRLWQPVHAGEGWDSWAVDGLVLHSTTSLGVILTSHFHDPGVENPWLTWFGGQIQPFCSRDDALVFTGQLGENQVFTGDSMITTESVLQFEINVGCGTNDPNLEFPVRLEYSDDGGEHWHLVVNDDEDRRNPYNRMPNQTPTVYSLKTTNVWRRETVMLSHLETSRPVRFRWYQGYLNGTDGHLAPQWALRNVILSPQCPELCNGHGRCTQEGSCDCDNGYKGFACETVDDPNPQDFHESFHGDWMENSYWARIIGGERRTESINNVGIGGTYVMDRLGMKTMETRDLDLSNANFVQFYLDSSESSPSEEAIFVLLEYSINGGIEWTTFEVIPLNEITIQRLFQVPLPSRAFSLAARLKWSQLGGQKSNKHTVWSIDEIYIGGEFYAKGSLDDDLKSVKTIRDNWMFVSGGTLEPSCDSIDSTLHFANHNGKSIVMTKDLKVTNQMYLQYETSTGCNHPNACNRVRLEYSDNYGLVWKSLPEECLPGEEITCNAYELHTELLSRATGYRRVITLPVPITNKGLIRFRWTSNDEPEYDWALHWVYAGADCGDCNGRGRCVNGSCLCNPDWTGNNCETSSIELLSSIRESFNNGWNSSLWSNINGGHVSSLCGTLDWGQALHFHEACDRYAETRELDLSNVKVVQFHLRSGCGQNIQNHPHQGTLLFQYSLNGGVKWQSGLTLSLHQFHDPKLVSFFVPNEAQTLAVKLRWWQLKPTGRMTEDWAIDSLIIDSPLDIASASDIKKKTKKIPEPDYQAEQSEPLKRQNLHDVFDRKLWWRKINVESFDSFCGRRGNILRGRSNTVEESILETSDFFVNGTNGRVLSFDMIVGDCGSRTDSVELAAPPVKLPVRFEVSHDHGVSWKLFHPLKTRGEKGYGPQIPSIYYKLDKWQTYQYSLELLSGVRFVRFRWRHPKSPVSVSWAINEFEIEQFEDLHKIGLESLMDDFNDGAVAKQHWQFFSGKITVPNEKLGDGAAGLFQGPGLKHLQTVELDLTLAQNVQFIIHFQLTKGLKDYDDSFHNVFLQCSSDNGFKWILIQDYLPRHHTSPTLVHAIIPEDCRYSHSILRWWQPIEPEFGFDAVIKSSVWLIDNIAVEYAQEQLTELYDNFKIKSLNHTQWQFYPNGAVSNSLCGVSEVDNSMIFNSGEHSRFVGITSKHITVKDNYAAHFKIRTNCGPMSCHSNNNRSQIRFEMRQGYEKSSWFLAKQNCLPSSTHSLCDPQMYHSSSAYTFGSFSTWHRVIIPLKSIPFANTLQFRWTTHKRGKGEKNTWAIKDVYIGEMCPSHCHGHGDCIRGRCLCDSGYEGPSCSNSNTVLSAALPVIDHFDDIVNPPLWEVITGGSIKVACGSLLPLAHGKHLHFDGCGIRMASTVPMDVDRVRRIAFVIRIGTPQQIPSCRIQPSNTYGSEILDRAVLLQYSYNGVDWLLLSSHGIRNFVQPQKMIYNVPLQTNSTTVQFRWWQPQHGGPNWDQWAIDNVEVLV